MCGKVVPQQVRRSLCQMGGVETHRGGLRDVTAISGVSNEDRLRVPPRSQDGLEGS